MGAIDNIWPFDVTRGMALEKITKNDHSHFRSCPRVCLVLPNGCVSSLITKKVIQIACFSVQSTLLLFSMPLIAVLNKEYTCNFLQK